MRVFMYIYSYKFVPNNCIINYLYEPRERVKPVAHIHRFMENHLG